MANSLITAGASQDAPASPASEGQSSGEKDTRVFMYRQDEARMFNSPDEVPAGEGWVDHPDKVGQTKEPPKKKAARKAEESDE